MFSGLPTESRTPLVRNRLSCGLKLILILNNYKVFFAKHKYIIPLVMLWMGKMGNYELSRKINEKKIAE